jgi:hypothetical protein
MRGRTSLLVHFYALGAFAEPNSVWLEWPDGVAFRSMLAGEWRTVELALRNLGTDYLDGLSCTSTLGLAFSSQDLGIAPGSTAWLDVRYTAPAEIGAVVRELSGEIVCGQSVIPVRGTFLADQGMWAKARGAGAGLRIPPFDCARRRELGTCPRSQPGQTRTNTWHPLQLNCRQISER